jgi:hypothetical protein
MEQKKLKKLIKALQIVANIINEIEPDEIIGRPMGFRGIIEQREKDAQATSTDLQHKQHSTN